VRANRAVHPQVRTLNVGTSAYGVDQAYLRYRHDVEPLAHDVHIFAFIPDDIERMRLAHFNGYPKPYFRLDHGRLDLRNVPVPRLSWIGEIMVHHQERLNDLRIVGFANRVVSRIAGGRRAGIISTNEEARTIAIELLDSLAASAGRYDRLTVFVLLEQRFGGNRQFDELATWLAAQASHRNLNFWDLRKEARTLPPDTLEALFNRTWGHYSVRGNAWVAEQLWRKLGELPGFERRLRSLEDGSSLLEMPDSLKLSLPAASLAKGLTTRSGNDPADTGPTRADLDHQPEGTAREMRAGRTAPGVRVPPPPHA
jgi:hypothetical protein